MYSGTFRRAPFLQCTLTARITARRLLLSPRSGNLNPADVITRANSQYHARWCIPRDDAVNNGRLSRLATPGSRIMPYWIDQLAQVEHEMARRLITQLTPDNPLGFTNEKGPIKKGTMLEQIISEKEKHPDKIILTRLGEFYETYGVDAVMMVAHAGLNAMAGKCKAGCPVKNIQATLNSLTDAGLVVAVYEEADDIDMGIGAPSSKPRLKQRYLSQIVSPASRTYMYNSRLRSDDIDYPENKPVVGILCSASGFTMCQLYLDEQSMVISERLSAEAARALLAASGCVEPLYVQTSMHSSTGTGSSAISSSGAHAGVNSDVTLMDGSESFGTVGIGTASGRLSDIRFLYDQHSVEKIYGYSESDFAEQILRKCAARFEINPVEFRVISRCAGAKQPKPIYTSTALQIGLIANDNVPDLVPNLLPRVHSAYSSRFLRNWLQIPPPHDIADAMRQLCISLAAFPAPLPPFKPAAIGKIVRFLDKTQCNVALFRQINQNIESLLIMLCQSSSISKSRGFRKVSQNWRYSYDPESQKHSFDFSSLVEPLLPLTSYSSSIPADAAILADGAFNVRCLITDVIAEAFEADTADPCFTDPWSAIPDEFFKRNEEEFRGRIKTSHSSVEDIYAEVHCTALALSQAVRREYPTNAEVMHDMISNKLCYRLKAGNRRPRATSNPVAATTTAATTTHAATTATTMHAATGDNGDTDGSTKGNVMKSLDDRGIETVKYVDKTGKQSSTKFTTRGVERALNAYLTSAAAAPRAVSAALKSLSEAVKGQMNAVVHATHWAVILHTAASHTQAAIEQRWCAATLLPDTTGIPSSSSSSATASDFASHFCSGDTVVATSPDRTGGKGVSAATSGGDQFAPQSQNERSAITNHNSHEDEGGNIGDGGGSGAYLTLKLRGLSPYWMRRMDCTLNDLDLEGVFLLTAPNMSGKSTLMRSILVAALLANCGLFVPASEAVVSLSYKVTSH